MLLIGSFGMTSCGKLGRCSDGCWGGTLFKDLFSFVNLCLDIIFTMSPLGDAQYVFEYGDLLCRVLSRYIES
jgi:hypothetical protein